MAVSVVHATTAAGPNDPTKQVSSDAWNASHTITGLATVATSGLYSDLSGTPDLTLKANVASPTFTGTPAGPTAAVNTNTTQLATTAYVIAQGYAAASTTLSGYGITDAYTKTASDARFLGIAAQAADSAQLLGKTWAVPAALGSTTPAAVTGTTVTASTKYLAPDGTKTAPAYSFSSDTGFGFLRPANAVLGFAFSGREFCRYVASGASEGFSFTNRIALGAAGSDLSTTAPDVFLVRDAGAIFAQRDSTNAQTYRIYASYTDASNYTRGALSASSTAVTLAAESAGTGSTDVGITLTPKGAGVVSAPLFVSSVSPGSFSLATETGTVLVRRLKLTSTQRATLAGTSRLVIR